MRRFGLAMILLCVLLLVASPALATESTAVPEMLVDIGRFGYSRSRSVFGGIEPYRSRLFAALTLQSVVGFFRGQERSLHGEIINGSCQYLFREVLGSAHLKDFDLAYGGCTGAVQFGGNTPG